MKRSDPQSRRSFTVIELLVVIAIISILISIILPIFKMRAALCPIAYVGTDLRLHVTTLQGGTDMDLAPADVFDTGSHCVLVMWSPSGDKIGFRTHTPSDSTCVIDPLTRKLSRFAAPQYMAFRGWQDSNSILQAQYPCMFVCDPNTGAVRTQIMPEGDLHATNTYVARIPANLNAYYVAMYSRVGPSGESITGVHLLTKSLRPCKTIWEQTRLDEWAWPRVDPTGEYVAWTHSGSNGFEGIAIKRVTDPSSVTPAKVSSKNFKFAVVCDWIDSNQILVNAAKVNSKSGDWMHGGTWGLYVIDRNGNIVREVPTSVPIYPTCVASYRKYGHE